MFTDFLYILRNYGMKTSLNEWNMLLEALNMDLNHASLTEFYHMSRAILVKKIEDYDRFDQAFVEYFKRIESPDQLPEELYKWLAKAMASTDFDKAEIDAMWKDKTLEEIRKIMEQRLREQKEQHHGGQKWVGTGGQTPFGHSGYAPHGIRVLGHGMNRSALMVAGERRFRDFRDDSTLAIRQYQVALKKLRLLSDRNDGLKTELDIDETIDETCSNAGMLKIVMKRPRKNQTKLLLLMDSGGSMWSYTELCNRLFQAVHRSSHFKDLKIYYFHNCIYDSVYKEPTCLSKDRVATERLLNNLKPEYKVIIVGDASMAPDEFEGTGVGFTYYRYDYTHNFDYDEKNQKSGKEWLKAIRKHFPAAVWLNPLHKRLWDYDHSTWTIVQIRKIFPMYQLSAAGLEQSIQKLKSTGP